MEDFKWDWTTQANISTNGAIDTTNGTGARKDKAPITQDNDDRNGQNNDSERVTPLRVTPLRSTCPCNMCMKDARAPVERQVGDEKEAIDRIAKLEDMVKHLQRGNNIHPSYSDFPLPPPTPFGGPVRRMSSSSSLSSIGSTVSIDTVSRKDHDYSEPTKGPKAEIRRCKKIHPYYGDPRIKKDRDVGFVESAPKNLDKEYVLTVFREFDKAGNFWRRYVEILSPSFIEVLVKVAPYDIDVPAVDGMLQVTEPLMLLFHHRKHLVNYLEDGNDDSNDAAVTTARNHTRLVLDFLQKEWDTVNQTLNDIESAEPSGVITFPNLWLLYAPGTIVFTKENGEYEALVVDSIRGISTRQTPSGCHTYSKLELTCWSTNYDGEVFGRVWSSHWVAPFYGSKEITSLDLIPGKFLPNASTVKESLVSRGKSFWALQGQNYREYTGEVWSQHTTEESVRVMVDQLTYQRRNNWPITINRKKGPSTAVNQNWKDNKFRHGPNVFLETHDQWGRRTPPPPPIMPCYEDDDRDYSPNRMAFRDEIFTQSYWTHPCDQPPMRFNSRFSKYDLLQPDQEPEYLALLLCPQRVHGYCLRDKIWSKSANFPMNENVV